MEVWHLTRSARAFNLEPWSLGINCRDPPPPMSKTHPKITRSRFPLSRFRNPRVISSRRTELVFCEAELTSCSTKQRQTTQRDRELSRPRPGFRKMQAQQIQEIVVCCSTPSTSTGSIAFHDIRTGAVLATFKQTNARTHGTDLVETKDGQGGFILSAQQDKSILNVYNYQKVHFEGP